MAETSLIAEAIKGLVASGPIALVLGLLCYMLWQQNTKERDRHTSDEQTLLDKLDRQHEKMLKLAVRVQRAVEVLAGIEQEPTEIETVLNEDERRETERKRLIDRKGD